MWLPWPASLNIPPDLHIACILARSDITGIAALLGHQSTGPRGRFGIVGMGQNIEISPNPGDLRQSLGPSTTPKIVLWSYEAGSQWMHLAPRDPPQGQPMAMSMPLDGWILVDHQQKTLRFGGEVHHIQALKQALDTPFKVLPMHASLRPIQSDTMHAQAITQAQKYIAAGEFYQANVTRRLAIDGTFDPATLLAKLSTRNPVAHGAFIRWGDFTLLSNSMETLLIASAETRMLTSMPIKGTLRGGSANDADLTHDQKERAEHVMIVDLVRNDLGRVAKPGTIHVTPWFDVERYQGVMHGVSTVRAELRPDQSIADAALALFPGGSITGAPKRRCIELLRTLENEPRGAYTGSLALVMPDGRVSMSILIRTMVHDARGWNLNVGGGITIDSIPEREVQETWDKVAVFKESLV